MRESTIEAYLRDRVKELGGKAYKFVSPETTASLTGWFAYPEAEWFFVELKAPGKKPTRLQIIQQKKLLSLDFQTWVIDSKTGVDEFIRVQRNFFIARKTEEFSE